MRNEATTLEAIVNNLLDALGVAHTDSYFIWAGGHEYQLDCYLPDHYAYIEADGPLHKLRTKKDRLRHQRLLGLGLSGLHLNHTYLTKTPKDEMMAFVHKFVEAEATTAADRRQQRGSDAFANFTAD